MAERPSEGSSGRTFQSVKKTTSAEAQAAREKLVPLDVRLTRLLDTIPPEVQTDGISLETLRKMLRGAKGRGWHCGAIGDELRRMGWGRERNWKKTENGFRAFWFPPS
jgi:hypothetical protein